MSRFLILSLLFVNYTYGATYRCSYKSKKINCLEKKIENQVLEYIKLLSDKNFVQNFLKNYEYSGKHGDWKTYEKKIASEVNEVLYSKMKNRDKLQIKKASGTIRLEFNYKYLLKRRVIKSISYSGYEGIQSIKSTTKILYRKFNNKLLPVKIKYQGIQSLGHKELARSMPSSRDFNQTIYVSYK